MRGIMMVLPLSLVVAAGYLCRRFGIIKKSSIGELNSLLFWVVVPVILFRATLKVNPENFSNVRYIAVIYLSFLLLPLLAWRISVFRKFDRRRMAVSAMVSIRGNNIFMGIPAITIAFGDPGIEALSLFLALGMVGFQTIAIAMGQLALSGGMSRKALASTLERLVRNPLILACFAGMSLSLMGCAGLPSWLDSSMAILANTGSGIALLAIGASLRVGVLGAAVLECWSDVLFRLFVAPSMVWCAFLVFPVDPVLMKTTVLLAAMPAAVNNFAISYNMGMDSEYTGNLVIATTALSILSLPIWLQLLG